jgi:hypothetical protein
MISPTDLKVVLFSLAAFSLDLDWWQTVAKIGKFQVFVSIFDAGLKW